jgi:hypothetical protein
LSRAADVDLSLALNAEHNGKVPARAALPAVRRQELTDRARGLSEYLAPARQDEIVRDLSRVFIALACKADDGIDAQTRALVYADILRDLPPFAVAKACADFCSGRAGDKKWAPTAAELRSVAQQHAAPWKREQERIERALAAEVVEEVDYRTKQAGLAHARETMQQLRAAIPWGEEGKVDAAKAQEPADEIGLSPAQKAEKWLREYSADAKPLPMLSDSARKALSLPPAKEGAAA